MNIKKVCFISNITLNPFVDKFIKNKNVEIHYMESSLIYKVNDKNMIRDFDKIVLWIDYSVEFSKIMLNYLKGDIVFEAAYKSIYNYCGRIIEYVCSNSNADIVWVGFENLKECIKYVMGFNYNKFDLCQFVNSKLVEDYVDKIQMIDMQRVIYEVGIEYAYDVKREYRWGCPYSDNVIREIINMVNIEDAVGHSKEIKCVVLDCDNVLWGGILQEEGIEGIKIGNMGIGRLYANFQRQLVELYCLGIVLVLNTKNDYNDIKCVFEKNKEMVLSFDMFACVKANWISKVSNLIDISVKLNIDIENMLFIDDTEYEILSVSRQFSGVKTYLFDIKKWSPRDLKVLVDKNLDLVSARLRNNSYQMLNMRRMCKVLDNNEYNTKTLISIKKADISEYGRISELSLRANKATNGKRFRLADIKRANENGYKIYSVYLEDLYGDMGLIGAIVCKRKKLNLICISCRAYGRGVDIEMKKFLDEEFEIVEMEYYDTGKNETFLDFVNREIIKK